MSQSFRRALLCLFLGPAYLSTQGQCQSSPADAARQQAATKSEPKKAPRVMTNDDLNGVVEAPKDPVATTFLNRIAGRWDFTSYHKGNASWWYDHGTAKPKTEIHYLFGPTELLIEKRPELDVPIIIDRFAYRSVRQISADLFDVELYKPSDAASVQIKRFKLSGDGKTLQISVDAPGAPEPTIQDLRFVDKNWVPAEDKPK